MATENTSPSHDRANILRKQVITVEERVQAEIKRLNEHLNESSGDAALYSVLIEEIKKIVQEAFSVDIISWLDSAAQNLEKAKEQANHHAPNSEIVENLQQANSLLYKAQNIKG